MSARLLLSIILKYMNLLFHLNIILNLNMLTYSQRYNWMCYANGSLWVSANTTDSSVIFGMVWVARPHVLSCCCCCFDPDMPNSTHTFCIKYFNIVRAQLSAAAAAAAQGWMLSPALYMAVFVYTFIYFWWIQRRCLS